MQIPEIEIKIKIRLYLDSRRSPRNVIQYPELNTKSLAMLASKGAGPRSIKRGRIFHCKAGPEEQLRQEVIINTARARIDSTHEGDQ
jgi:hypothetical protein